MLFQNCIHSLFVASTLSNVQDPVTDSLVCVCADWFGVHHWRKCGPGSSWDRILGRFHLCQQQR